MTDRPRTDPLDRLSDSQPIAVQAVTFVVSYLYSLVASQALLAAFLILFPVVFAVQFCGYASELVSVSRGDDQ
jgi:hypothetical protein